MDDVLLYQDDKPSNLLDVGVDPIEAKEKGRVDINFFASIAMPDVMISALPLFYVLCFQLFTTRPPHQQGKILRFALGLPRGHAKTTFIKILVAWLIAYDRNDFIVVVCANVKLATNIISDISNIMSSTNMELIYGKWDTSLEDNKESKRALYHDRIIMLEALGAASAVRGLNKNNKRPNLILMDDMQTSECAESPTENLALLRWMVATLLKAGDDKGDRLYIFIGNMYNEECILKKLQNSSSWISLITGAILEDGTPLWEDIFSLDDLMESFIHDEELGLAEAWFAEVMNDPRNRATSLIVEPLPNPLQNENYIADGVFITLDPAGYRDHSDDNVIVVHEVFDGKGIIAKTDAGKFDPEEMVKRTLTHAITYGATVIGVEAVAYQQTLKFWLEKYIETLELHGIEVVELKPHGRSKESRIRAFVAELYTGNYMFKSAEERALFVYQAMKYKLGKKKNEDDLLDAEAYGLDMRNDYWQLIGNNLGRSVSNKTSDIPVVEDNTPF